MGVGTFSQIYVQIVFAVKGRKSAIHPSWEEELFKYITGIVQGKEQKMIRINGMPDHIHMLVGIRPSCRISDLVRELKKHQMHLLTGKNSVAKNLNGKKVMVHSRIVILH